MSETSGGSSLAPIAGRQRNSEAAAGLWDSTLPLPSTSMMASGDASTRAWSRRSLVTAASYTSAWRMAASVS